MIIRSLSLLVLCSVSACSEAAPSDAVTGTVALAAAQKYRDLAEKCFQSSTKGEAPVCGDAAFAYQSLSHTPNHFAGQDWQAFQEAWSGGNNLMLRVLLTQGCERSVAVAATRANAICVGSNRYFAGLTRVKK